MISAWTFGTHPDGTVVTAYELKTASGLRAVVLDHGATLQALYLPDGRNIVLGHDTLDAYLEGHDYRGAFIGRNANRIVGASFEIDGTRFDVPANDGDNNLHSGPAGLNVQRWAAGIEGDMLHFRYSSPNGHQGFPGCVEVELSLLLTHTTLRLNMSARTDSPTPVNLTWHPYWNLNGHGRIDGHDLQVGATHRTVLERADPIAVRDTRFDFRKSLPLGGVRLDDNYQSAEGVTLKSGQTRLSVTSSLPDLQVYTGDTLTAPRTGIALEPQFRPDDVNRKQASVLRPGAVYAHWIEYDIKSLLP